MSTTIQHRLTLALGLAAAVALSGCSTMNSSNETGQIKFRTPEEAVAAVADVAGTGNQPRVDQIFGANSADLLQSGDETADRNRAGEIKALIQQKVAFENLDATTKAALFGNDAWPFPIPLVKERGGWRFDTEAGREEIENRRVGLNELETLATLHTIVDAQKEYRAGRHDGRSGAYARRVISSEGKHDGLYWPAPEGKVQSPLGPRIADAAAEGYAASGEPTPYHGYFYRMLTAQGASAPGGAKDYLDAKGGMTKGFAMLAWPAKYGNSGKMTFVVGKQGIVYQKDLGEGTAEAASAIPALDPDESWTPTGD